MRNDATSPFRLLYRSSVFAPNSKRLSLISPSIAAFFLELRQAKRSAAISMLISCGLLCGRCAQGQTGFGSQTIGSSVTDTVAVRIQLAGTLVAIQVLTWGVPGADFIAASSGATCVEGSLYSVGQTCSVPVVFAPAFPGARAGAIVLIGETGSVLATAYLSGTGVGALGVLVPGVIHTVAGNGQWTTVGDGQLATTAELFLPASVAVDGVGDLYIADSVHNRIRKVDAATGVIATIAGNGSSGYTGDNGPAVNSALSGPNGVTLDGAGNVYIADTANQVIRKITSATGIISTVAGSGSQGDTGDAGPATSAKLNSPAGVTIDPGGNIAIADTGNHRIRVVNASTGIIATVAGNGVTRSNGRGTFSGDGGAATLAGLNFPYAVAYDSSGNVYIPDSANHRIRMVSAMTGKIETIAGSSIRGFAGDNGPANQAGLYAPSGVAVDAAENLFIADTQNNRIRKVNATTGIITTIAGNGAGKFAGDATSAVVAGLYGPYCVFVGASGDLFIADYFDNRIREISSGAALLSFTPPLPVGSISMPQNQLVENDGNAALTFASILPDANAAEDSAATTCSLTGAVAPDDSCVVSVEFAPTQAGKPVVGHIAVTEIQANTSLDIAASGQALALNSTVTRLTSSANPLIFGQTAQLLATVTSAVGRPVGAVTFTAGGSALGAPIALNASGAATYSLSADAIGAQAIVAAYNGDASHAASVSAPLAQVVDEATAAAIVSSQNPAAPNASVTLSATVTSAGGGVPPSGPVIFEDGAVSLGTIALDGLGKASLTVSGLAVGSHSITASYGGLLSAFILGSVSPALSQIVQGQTTTMVSSAANPSIFGQAISLLVKVTGVGQPAGTVTFTDGVKMLGAPVELNAYGAASSTIASAAVGLHSIVAHYSGDAGHLASMSGVLAQVVDERTATTIASSQNPCAPNATITLSATVLSAGGDVTPNGPVVFQDGPTTLGVAALDGFGKAILTVAGLTPGQHSITASYSGPPAAYILDSTSNALSQAVEAQTTTFLKSSVNPSTFGGATVFSAIVTTTGPALAAGTVTFFDGPQQIGSAPVSPSPGNALVSTGSISTSALAAGIHLISAEYAGDRLNTGSISPPLAQTIYVGATGVAAGSSINPSVVLAPIILSASVTGTRGPPGGVVVFLADAAPLATQMLDSTGFASISTSALPVGLHQLSVNYLGDDNNAASGSTQFTQIVQAIPTTTSLSSSNSGGASSQISLSASVEGVSGPIPTGSVAFLSGVTTLGAGNLNASGVAVFTLPSNSAPTGIVAAYPGDRVHGPSSSTALYPPTPVNSFQLILNPDTVTLLTSQNIQVTVTLNPASGFTDRIGLGCASLPARMTCYFSKDSVALDANGAVTEQLTIDTDSPLSGGPVALNRGPESSRVTLAGGLLPAAWMLVWLFLPSRRRSPKPLHQGAVVLFLAIASQLTGCGAITRNSVAPGAYVIQVVATGITSGVTKTIDLTVDVTRE
jgi:sugar lactone lactonase YvrE